MGPFDPQSGGDPVITLLGMGTPHLRDKERTFSDLCLAPFRTVSSCQGTHAPQQAPSYSTTSSAIARRLGGISKPSVLFGRALPETPSCACASAMRTNSPHTRADIGTASKWP